MWLGNFHVLLDRFFSALGVRRRRAQAMLRTLDLFGRPLRVVVWDRDGDRRVFVGPRGCNDLEYYGTGDHWHPPDWLWAPAAIRAYADRQGITHTQAEAEFRNYCAQLLTDWHTLTIWPEQYPRQTRPPARG